MNSRIFRSRRIGFIAIIFVAIFLLPIFVGDYSLNIKAMTDDNSALEIARKPLDSTTISELTYWDDNYGSIGDIVVEGNYIYAVLSGNGFIIIDISDIANPVVVTQWKTYACSNLDVENDRIFVTNTTSFYVLDASDFNNMYVICNYTGLSTPKDIVADGNFVHITDNTDYHIFNITDLTNPYQTDNYTPNTLTEMQLDGDIMYIKDSSYIRILNVSDVNNIVLLSSVYHVSVYDFARAGNVLFTSTTSQVSSWNITTLSSPTAFDTYALNYTGAPSNLAIKGNYLVVCKALAFEIIDITNASELLYYTHETYTFQMNNIIIKGDAIFTYNIDSIKIFNCADLTDITEIFVDQYNGSAQHVYLFDKYAFVADGTNLQIVNVKDPANPVEIGQFFDENDAFFRVYVHNDFAYILENDLGLRIVDVSDPTNPIERGNFTLSGDYIDLCANDEYVFIACEGAGLRIIDVYYPDYPQQSLLYQELGDVYDVEIMDTNLYLACGEYLQIVDISNPYEPEPIGNYTRDTSYYIQLDVSNNYVYALSLFEGFDIIDIKTDITEPVKIGQYFTYAMPVQIQADGQYIYLLDDSGLFEVFDATNIAHPKKIGDYDEINNFGTFAAKDGYIYVTTGLNGTHVLTTSPLLQAKLPFIGPGTFFAGLSIFSLMIILIRKKRNN
ncbi:MAG: hypothetical protein FK734_07545 [Asgard group archaeon]|nr:hypothetical protein [Asgard group archaeon]